MKAKIKRNIFDSLVNRNYRPSRRKEYQEPPQQPQQDRWIQTSPNTWQRVNGVFNSVQNPFNSVQEPFINDYNNGYSRSFNRSENENNRYWKVKANRTAIKNRYGLQKGMITAVMTALALGSTIMKFDLRIQIILYLVWIGVLMLADPLGAIGRFVAFPSRVMIAGCCVTLVLLFCRPGMDFLLITAIMITASFFCIRTLNDSWLAADNWSNTQAVQKAMEHDPNCLAGKNWQADGRREVRTALAEMGISTDPNCLDTLHRTAFEIGYSHGLQKTGQIRATESKLIQAREEVANYKKQYSNLEYELRAAKQEQERAALLSNQADIWRKKYADLKRENEQLLQANEELLQSFQEEEEEIITNNVIAFAPSTPKKTKQQCLEEKVLYARYELDYSFEKCGKYAGCSKSTAYNIIKAAEKETAAM